MKVHYRTRTIDEVLVFYREAGDADAPVVVLLHGFPTSSHMFRDLIPQLAKRYRVIAPDLPGFGRSVAPPRGTFTYSFDSLAQVVERFLDALELRRIALYVFDYGAPVGFRVAMHDPARIGALLSQNGNAYAEALSDAWGPWQTYWREPTPAHREACRASLSEKTIREFQYLHGSDAQLVSPDGYTLDLAYLARQDAAEIQLDLILDYRTNLERYPEFQAYFRRHQPPVLAAWGRNDASFLPLGAELYARDIRDAEVHLLDTGHFALETHAGEIGALVLDFLDRKFR